MKTKELIEQLKLEDPSGELEVSVENAPISYVMRSPAYWDGPQRQVIKDEYHRIVKYKLARRGNKVDIKILDREDVFYDYPDAEVDLSECNPWMVEDEMNKINQIRKDAKEIEEELKCSIKEHT